MSIHYGVRALRRSRKNCRQRAERGFSDEDVWNLFVHLGNVIADSIQQLSETCHGHPIGLTEQEWTDILAKIELGFRLAGDDDWMFPLGPHIQENERRIKEAFDLLHEWWFALWD